MVKTLYELIDAVAMEKPSRHSLAYAFLVYHGQKFVRQMSLTVILSTFSPKRISKLFKVLSSEDVKFTIETEWNNKISFLNCNIICDQGKFTINVY